MRRGLWMRRAAVIGALAVLIAATRWTLAPKYLFTFDQINFALALRDFNPVLHQPQPPGYPLFVALEKLIHAAVPVVKDTQLLAGAVGSVVALAALWRLGGALFGAPAGALAAALLVFNPVFWLAGIADPVRTFLAAGATATALCAWRAFTSPHPARWFARSSSALGAAAGFRPELLLLLLPLWIFAVVARRLSPGAIAGGLLACAAAVAPWLLWTIQASGGLSALLGAFEAYRRAHLAASFSMAALAIYWAGLGCVTWAWALPSAWPRLKFRGAQDRLVFLAAWFLPPFLFHVLVHSDDPDHLLDCIPVTCLAGGWALAQARGPLAARAIAAAALNALLFFAPPYRLGKEASYRFVRRTGDAVEAAVDGIARLRGAGTAAVLVAGDASVTARQIGYYFPRDPVLAAAPATGGACEPAYLPRVDAIVFLPAAGPPVALDPRQREFQIGGCRFIRAGSPARPRP